MIRRLQGPRSGVPSRMHTEHLREWLRDHRKVEAVAEAETIGEKSGPEGWDRTATVDGLMVKG